MTARAAAAARPAEEAGTRERILRVAERLFAEHGFKAVSVRAITAAAGINLAGVSYWFGSKEGLVAAIYESRCRPMAEERLRRLAACAEGRGRPPLLEQIIAAFIGPALDASVDAAGGGAVFTRLRALLTHDSNALARDLVARHFDETSLRFVAALCGALPELTRGEAFWRFHFLLGTLYYTMITPGRIDHLSGGLCDPRDVGAAMARMVPFLAAGFRAAAPLPFDEARP